MLCSVQHALDQMDESHAGLTPKRDLQGCPELSRKEPSIKRTGQALMGILSLERREDSMPSQQQNIVPAESWQGFSCAESNTYAHRLGHCSAQLHAIMPPHIEQLMTCSILRLCHPLPSTGLSLMLLHKSYRVQIHAIVCTGARECIRFLSLPRLVR